MVSCLIHLGAICPALGLSTTLLVMEGGDGVFGGAVLLGWWREFCDLFSAPDSSRGWASLTPLLEIIRAVNGLLCGLQSECL